MKNTFLIFATGLCSQKSIKFIKLKESERNNIVPKLCLYIPYIQNYFMAGATDEVRDEMLGILSKTTQVRRRSNVNTIIQSVKDSIEYEL